MKTLEELKPHLRGNGTISGNRESSEFSESGHRDIALPDPDAMLECIARLEAIVENRALMAQLSEDDRKRLVMAAGRIAKPDRIALKQLTREFRRQDRKAAAASDRAAKAATGLRQARTTAVYVAPARHLPQGSEKSAPALPRGSEKSGPYLPRGRETLPGDLPGETPPLARLSKAQPCYVCKAPYVDLHFFYDSMCPACAAFNYKKRFQTADCRGRVALVTGARVKIGYHAALMLLRAGASVIVTTRFPHDAALRYRRESDFADWRDRLQIYGLDLRHAPSVELFAHHISERYPTLDFLLNNAAQTVRKPRGFYDHLMDVESRLPDDPDAGALLRGFTECRAEIDRNSSLAAPGTPTNSESAAAASPGLLTYNAGNPVGTSSRATPAPGLYASAQMSQLPLLPDDLSCGTDVFPEGHLDADLQQVDLRSTNSWRMKLADVSTAEMLEIQLINAVAPFILNSKLKPLMLRPDASGEVRRDKHIVNVSAMEGKFSRYTKTDKHPHTNMAKAALNMMTQTSAPDYVQDGIHMNAVDTGWVTDEDPAQHAHRKRLDLGFEPPLDIVDGAARIVDPFFHGLNTGEHIWGKFLKDYVPTGW